MELSDDKIYEICEFLPNSDLNAFVRANRTNQRICGGLLMKRREEKIMRYVKKFSTENIDINNLEKVIRLLVETEAPDNKLYVPIINATRDISQIPHIFKGNLSKTILNLADLIFDKSESLEVIIEGWGNPPNLLDYIFSLPMNYFDELNDDELLYQIYDFMINPDNPFLNLSSSIQLRKAEIH